MDRTTEDKLMSNVSALKNELDNYYLNGLTPEVTALAARICDLAGGHDDLIRRYNDLERLIESLTPGGSEFAGDPEACAAWVRARLAATGKLAAERNRYRDAGKALADSYQDGAKFVAKYAADTGSVLAQRALDRMEIAQRQWQEATDE